MQRAGSVKTGAGAHGFYAGRDATFLYVSDRDAGAVSVINLRDEASRHHLARPR
jgi:hypothetical protein